MICGKMAAHPPFFFLDKDGECAKKKAEFQ